MKPQHISVSENRSELTLSYENLPTVSFSSEFLRVLSPSAEVQGHGPGQAVLQTGKRLVTITDVEPVGRYAIRIVFSDGHKTGIFSWIYLRELAENKDEMWSDYLKALEDASCSRDG